MEPRAQQRRGFRMRLALTCLLVLVGGEAAFAAKATRFWNLTDNTITSLQLAPAGTDKFGEDQCKNDKDGSVDHDERLKILGVTSGNYDARFTDFKGRTCTAKAIAIKEGDIFTIEEKQADCGK